MDRRQFLVTIVCICGFAFLGGLAAFSFFHGQPAAAEETVVQVEKALPGGNPDGPYLGLVKAGKFLVVQPAAAEPVLGTVRLTEIQMQEARPPESAELNLADYEGKAIMVSGHNGGGWIYRAAVIDCGGPIVTALVEELFARTNPMK